MLLPVKARLLSEEAELEHLYGREHVTHHYRCGEGLCAGGISKSDLVYFEALSGLNEPSFHGEITPIVPWRSGISWLSVMFAYLGQSFLFFLLAMLVVGFSYASIVPWYWSLSMWFRTGVLALFWGTLTHQSWENFTRTRLRRLFDRWSWGGGALWVRHRRLTGIAQIKTLVIHQGRFGLDLAMAQASITVTNSTMASTFHR